MEKWQRHERFFGIKFSLVSIIQLHICIQAVLQAQFKVESKRMETKSCLERDPPEWPKRFVLVQRLIPSSSSKMKAATVVTYYDEELGANLIQQTPDNLTEPIFWDLELNNKNSYYFYPTTQKCLEREFPVGILKRDWLKGSVNLGESIGWNGRVVCGYTKDDFLEYYADKETMEPVSWYFHTMKASFNTIYYSPETHVPDVRWFDPPEYCSKSETEGLRM